MNASSLSAGRGRLMAVLLLLVSLLCAYFLLVHWWFTEPLMAARTQFLDLREQEQRPIDQPLVVWERPHQLRDAGELDRGARGLGGPRVGRRHPGLDHDWLRLST